MKPYEPATSRLNTLDRLDQIRMSASDRRAAKAYLRQAELLADVLMWVDAAFRRVLGFVVHGIRALARRSEARAVTAEPN